MTIIRAARMADLSVVTRICGHTVETGTASYELVPPTLQDMTLRMEALCSQGYPYLVAEEAGEVVGFAYAGPFRPRRAYRFVVEDSIYISPEAQGRGIGHLLLQALIAECQTLGFRQIVAVIGDGSAESASVKLHASLGFHHKGVLEGSGYKHDRWLDTVFMQLALNGGDTLPPDPDSLPERLFRAREGK